MAKSSIEFTFIYHRPKFFPGGALKHYRGGIIFNPGDTVKADSSEVDYLTNKKIGNANLFEKKRKAREKKEYSEVQE